MEALFLREHECARIYAHSKKAGRPLLKDIRCERQDNVENPPACALGKKVFASLILFKVTPPLSLRSRPPPLEGRGASLFYTFAQSFMGWGD